MKKVLLLVMLLGLVVNCFAGINDITVPINQSTYSVEPAWETVATFDFPGTMAIGEPIEINVTSNTLLDYIPLPPWPPVSQCGYCQIVDVFPGPFGDVTQVLAEFFLPLGSEIVLTNATFIYQFPPNACNLKVRAAVSAVPSDNTLNLYTMNLLFADLPPMPPMFP